MSKTIDLDTKTFVRFWLVILGFAGLIGFVFLSWKGLLVIGMALFLAIAIRPLAKKINGVFLKRKKTNKEQLSAVLAFLIVVLGLVLIVAVIGPVVVSETANFVKQLPKMFDNVFGGLEGLNDFGRNFGIDFDLKESLVAWISEFSNKIGNFVVSSLSAVASLLASFGLCVVLTLLFLLEGPRLYDGFFRRLSGRKKNESVDEARKLIGQMCNVISTYVSKQFSIALLDGGVTAFVVFILALVFGFSISLAIPMGLITMLFYLIPMFGQVIGCSLVSLILLFSNPLAGIVFAVFYIVYAQIENNGIAPKIQGDALKLSPLVVLIAITIGVYVSGFLGAIVAIPVAGCLKVLIDDYPTIKEIREKRERIS